MQIDPSIMRLIIRDGLLMLEELHMRRGGRRTVVSIDFEGKLGSFHALTTGLLPWHYHKKC